MGWDTACPDWQERLLAGRTLVPDLPLFEDEAARAVRIFNRLRIPDVIGQPRMGEAGTDWLLPIVRAIFGAYDPATNRRMIQEFFWLVPKKNSKSSGAAAIMVTVMIVNRRPLAEALLIAPTKEVAGIAYRQAWGIIQADPELSKLFHGQEHVKKITHRVTGATMQIKAADTDVITGSKAAYTLIDETHVFARKPRAADVFVELRGALASRPDGFLMQVTTQSKEPPSGVFKAELETARKVRDGALRLPLLPVLYELPPGFAKDGGWKDRVLWPLVNPNLGRSVNEAFLANELTKAEATGPEALALFASQHLNVEIGLALRSDRWIGADHWERQARPGLDLAEVLRRSDVVTIGVDGGGLDDLLGLAVLGRDKVTRQWLLWCRAWCNVIALERRKSEAARLRDFEQDGDLVIVSRMDHAFAEVSNIIEQVNDTGLLAKVGFDPVGSSLTVADLSSRGISESGGQVEGVSQGYKLTGTIKDAEVQLSDGKMVHAGQPLMAWCVGNAKVEPKGNAVVITKQVSGTGKIDPLMATFNAINLMVRNPEPQSSSSVYNDLAHELLVI